MVHCGAFCLMFLAQGERFFVTLQSFLGTRSVKFPWYSPHTFLVMCRNSIFTLRFTGALHIDMGLTLKLFELMALNWQKGLFFKAATRDITFLKNTDHCSYLYVWPADWWPGTIASLGWVVVYIFITGNPSHAFSHTFHVTILKKLCSYKLLLLTTFNYFNST